MAVEPSGMIATLLALLEAMLGGWQGPEGAPSEGVLERVVVYCLVWSVGGLVRGEDRLAVDAHLRSMSDMLPPKVRCCETLKTARRSCICRVMMHSLRTVPPT